MGNPFSLKNKNILVTGASSGIGKAIAVECSKMGANVLITARNEERLTHTLAQMEDTGRHEMLIADLSCEEDIFKIVDWIGKKMLDGIVQCAGFAVSKSFLYLSRDDVRDVMQLNFEAPVYLTQMLLKKKKVVKGASIVFISSISGVYCSAVAASAYSASKGAVNGIVKGMAIELAPKGIRVNCVNPGMIKTGIYDAGIITQEQMEEDAKKYPLKRYGNPEEVAYAVIYLLSDASCWVTGTNLVIDGGFTLL